MTMSSAFLDRAKLDAAYITFSTLFDMQLTRAPTVFQDITTVIPVATTQVDFKWFGDVPKMKEWIGPRAINKLRAETHSIRTKNWSNGIEVERDDIADDKLGLVTPRIQALADEGMWGMEQLVMDFLQDFAGAKALTYDAKPLISTTHTASGAGGVAQSNDQAVALDETNYQGAWAKMLSFKDTMGTPLRIMPDTLLVGVANRTVARKLIQQETKATGEQNIEAGTSRLIVHPYITATNWFLISTRQAVRALILLIRQSPQFAAVDSMNGDTHSFMNATFLYGADARYGAGFGLWQTIVGSDGV